MNTEETYIVLKEMWKLPVVETWELFDRILYDRKRFNKFR